MASEIQTNAAADSTVYAIVRNAAGLVWDTVASAFVAFVDANVGRYDVPLIEQGTSSGYYAGDFPSAIQARGTYNVVAYRQSGVVPNVADNPVGSGEIEWDGQAEVASRNLITLAYAKRYLRLTTLANDALIVDLIAAASAAVVNYCRRAFALATYNEYYNPSQHSRSLVLRNYPVVSVAEVVLNPHDVGAEVIEGSNYIADVTGELYLNPSSVATAVFPAGSQSVRVEYVAGFATIPADVQLACAMIVSNAYSQAGKDNTLNAERLGDYSYQLRAAVSSSIVVNTEIKDILDKYREAVVV